jgi:hypothetical protein
MLLGQAALLLAGYNYLKIGSFVLKAKALSSEEEMPEIIEPIGEIFTGVSAEPVSEEAGLPQSIGSETGDEVASQSTENSGDENDV